MKIFSTLMFACIIAVSSICRADDIPSLLDISQRLQSNHIEVYKNRIYPYLAENSSIPQLRYDFYLLRQQLITESQNILVQNNRINELNENTITQAFPESIDNTEEQQRLLRKYNGAFSRKLYKLFIKTEHTVDAKTQAKNLTHEFVHGYQYLFRLPIDILWLKQQGYSAKEGFNYLDFHYEAEAHWLLHQMYAPKKWMDYHKSLADKDLNHSEARFHIANNTFGIPAYINNYRLEKMLPKVDQPNSRSTRQFGSATIAGLFLTFPVITNQFQSAAIGGEIHLKYHRKFSLAIAKSYDQFANHNVFAKNNYEQENIYRPMIDNSVKVISQFTPEQVAWISEEWTKLFAVLKDQNFLDLDFSNFFRCESQNSICSSVAPIYQKGLTQYQVYMRQHLDYFTKNSVQGEVDLSDPDAIE